MPSGLEYENVYTGVSTIAEGDPLSLEDHPDRGVVLHPSPWTSARRRR